MIVVYCEWNPSTFTLQGSCILELLAKFNSDSRTENNYYCKKLQIFVTTAQ